MRCFLGIEITDEIRKGAAEIQEKIKSSEADIKFVELENLHFTVKFLGDVEKIEIVKAVAEDVAKKYEPFEIEVGGIVAQPSINYIRNFGLGVCKGEKKFVELLREINKKLDMIRKEGREPKPHLTLGRVRSAKNKERLKRILAELKGVKIGKMEINEIVLYRSELKQTGPVYSILDRFKFG